MILLILLVSYYVYDKRTGYGQVMGETTYLDYAEVSVKEVSSDTEVIEIPKTVNKRKTLTYQIEKKEVPTPKPVVISGSSDIFGLFQKYATVYNLNLQTLITIANCESRMNPEATNGPYVGLFQFHTNTWISTRTEMGEDPNPVLRTNAEESIKTASYKISRYGTRFWPACASLITL